MSHRSNLKLTLLQVYGGVYSSATATAGAAAISGRAGGAEVKGKRNSEELVDMAAKRSKTSKKS